MSNTATTTLPKEGILSAIKIALKDHPFEHRFSGDSGALAAYERMFPKNMTAEDVLSWFDKAWMRLQKYCDLSPGYAGSNHEDSIQRMDEHWKACADCHEISEQLNDLKKVVFTAALAYADTGLIQPPATASDTATPQDGTHQCARVGCNNTFTPKRKTGRYCSARCRKLHFTAMQERNVTQA